MREIKFRAWDKEHRAMLPCIPIEAVTVGRFLEMHGTTLHLMQFTGLFDKNGKEIYEGDILEWSARDNDGSIMKSVDTVAWKNGAFVTGIKNDEESFYDEGNRKQITKQSKIIGNIYENPELLAQTK